MLVIACCFKSHQDSFTLNEISQDLGEETACIYGSHSLSC